MPDAVIGGSVGPQAVKAGDGAFLDLSLDSTGAPLVSERQARFHELANRGLLFMGGMGLTSISNATFTTATTGVTATPIAGVWNPSTSTVNLIILQAYLGVTMTALQATGVGAFAWMVAVGNAAISTGAAPYNTKTLVATGSFAKNMAGAALTGMTGTLATVRGSSLTGGSAVGVAFLATQAGAQTQQTAGLENIDGSIIVPPGGILALMATVTGVGHSATSGLLWAEVPV